MYTHGSSRVDALLCTLRQRQTLLRTDISSLQVCLTNLSCSSTLAVNVRMRLIILELKYSSASRFIENIFFRALPLRVGQRVPALSSTMVCVARSPSATAVGAAQHCLEERLQAWQTGRRDCNVQLGSEPDGDVARVPQEVSFLAVVSRVRDLDSCCDTRE